jgi:phosphoglycolate phosphatase
MIDNELKLIVFDWDGTLMDSEARIVDCMRSALGEAGCGRLADGQIREIIGLGLSEAIRALLPVESEATREEVAERYRHHWLHGDRQPSLMFPGAEQTLRRLADEDYLLAVATGKSRRGLQRAFDESGLQPLFQATRCADESFSKPHPQMLLEIMDRLGVGPAETLMIGDTEYDMQMATNAGAWGLGVSHGVHSAERLLANRALDCLDSLLDIPPWLERETPARPRQIV